MIKFPLILGIYCISRKMSVLFWNFSAVGRDERFSSKDRVREGDLWP